MEKAPHLHLVCAVILRIAVILAALGAALVPLPAAWVEALYSQRAYLSVQRTLTAASNRVPFSLFDGLLALALVWLIFAVVGFFRGWRKPGPLRSAIRLSVRVAAAAAFVYLAFLLLWGLNYRRVPLSQRLAFAQGQVSSESAGKLARAVIRRANELRAPASKSGAGKRSGRATEPPDLEPPWEAVPAILAPSFAAVQRQLANVQPAAGGTPKPTLLTYYFERSGVDGMTDPFFLETLVNRSVLPVERAFITAHEWAHLAGYADESEANFVGWLVCFQGAPAAEYSGHLALLWQLLSALPAQERNAALADVHPTVREDLRGIAARLAKATPVIRQMSWRVYDRYLKANRVEKGIQSYDAALNLLLGTTFTKGWVPQLRGADRNRQPL